MKRGIISLCFVIVIIVVLPSSMCSQELKPIKLPTPQTDGGRPLMQVLKERKSVREFSNEKLPLQVLSNLLWAAYGINRPESGKRTAPSAVNWQEIDIYVATDSLYLYDAENHALKPILAEDIRALTGRQSFVKDAPVNLIFVADFSKMGNASLERKEFFSACDVGFVSQNVYLFCASEGLATVVRGNIDIDKLSQKMGLRSDQKILLAQTIGYPKI